MSRKEARQAPNKKRNATRGTTMLTAGKKRTSRKGAKAQNGRGPRAGKITAPAQPSPRDFSPTLGGIAVHLFGEGKHLRIYEKLGAHVLTHEGERGVAFAVWAPNAERVGRASCRERV